MASQVQSSSDFLKIVGNYFESVPDCSITPLDSPQEVKTTWLSWEWSSPNLGPKSKVRMRETFPEKSSLLNSPSPSKVSEVFHFIRGQHGLWQETREEGEWVKVTTSQLSLSWVEKNIQILYPYQETFELHDIGFVLWYNPNRKMNQPSLQIIEGNHRVSSWMNQKTLTTLPAEIYIGKTSPTTKNAIEIDGPV